MKVFLVYIGDILHCPPAISLIHALDDLQYEVKVCLPKIEKSDYARYFDISKRVQIIEVSDKYEIERNMLQKELDLHRIRKFFWNYYDNNAEKDSLIWVLSSGTVKYLGNRLLKENYILHLLELTEELYYIESKHLIKLSKEYARNANCVVECEYNRAHITKAWWMLDELPTVLPNKPYPDGCMERNQKITSSGIAAELLEKIEGKKIVLYQGNMSKERPIDLFIKAVSQLGEKYAFVAMTNSNNPYPDLLVDNYYHIPFIAPPFHLEVTSHAYIGILSYTPIINDYSILNTLFCAPNKTWEYAKYGIPMIGNDLPALKSMFVSFGNGLCIDEMNIGSIKDAIRLIDEDYSSYNRRSFAYYNSFSFIEKVKSIIQKAHA